MTASTAEHFDLIKMLLCSKSLIFRLFCGGLLYCETGLALSRSPAALFSAVKALFFDSLTHAGQVSGVCQFGLAYMIMQFLGQASAQVPQATHLSSSRVQVLAARSTVRAPAGHFLAQRVQ